MIFCKFDDRDAYRNLDYTSWLKYVHGVFIRAIDFSIDEHDIFERTEKIFESFEKVRREPADPDQKHEILRAIDIGLRESWGKKTEKRLINNGLTADEIDMLSSIVKRSVAKR